MQLSLLLAQKIAGMFLMLLLGFLVVRLKVLRSQDSRVLSKICMYIVIPCVIINAFQIECTPDRLHDFLVLTLAALIAQGLFTGVTMLLRRPLKLRRIEQLSMIYPNTGNLIFPLVLSVFGEEMLFFVCPYTCIFSMTVWTHGRMLVESDGKMDFKKVFLNINVICCLLGMLCFILNIKLPRIIGDTVASLSGTVGPLSMLLTGMLIGGADLKKVFTQRRAYLIALIRLVIYPVLLILLLKITGLHRFATTPTVMMITLLAASAPSATTVTNLAQVYNSDPEIAATVNIITLLGCIITMPLINLLYQLVLL